MPLRTASRAVPASILWLGLWFGFALACVACSGASQSTPKPPPDPASVTLGWRLTPVGTVIMQDRSTVTEAAITADGKPMALTSSEVMRRKIEVLKTSGDAVTQARYTFVAIEIHEKVDGKDGAPPSPLAGKTYVLEAGPPTNVSVDGQPASPREADEVRKTSKHFGEPDRFGKFLAGKTFEKGKPFPIAADILAAAFGDSELAGMTLTFRRLDGANAVFDLVLTLHKDENGTVLDATATGDFVLDAKTGDIVSMHAKGKLDVTGAITGAGTITMSQVEQH